jgi:hypothetical protein
LSKKSSRGWSKRLRGLKREKSCRHCYRRNRQGSYKRQFSRLRHKRI